MKTALNININMAKRYQTLNLLKKLQDMKVGTNDAEDTASYSRGEIHQRVCQDVEKWARGHS